TKKEHGDADLAYDRAETELRAMSKSIPQFEADVLKAERRRNAQELVVANIRDQIRAIEKRDGDCPTCGRPMRDAKDHKHAKRELQRLDDQLYDDRRTLGDRKADLSKAYDVLEIERAAQRKFAKDSDDAKDKY